ELLYVINSGILFIYVNALSTTYTKSSSLYSFAISKYLLYPLYKYLGSFVAIPFIVTNKHAPIVMLYATFLFAKILYMPSTTKIAISGSIGIIYLIAYFTSTTGDIFATKI